MTKDTIAIISTIIIAVIAIVGINKTDISELRADMRELRTEVRELRGLLITHVAGHSHSQKVIGESEKTVN